MRLLDWLRDGILSDHARLRRAAQAPLRRVERQERADPSGPHHFGRRAHNPDPNGQYVFTPVPRVDRPMAFVIPRSLSEGANGAAVAAPSGRSDHPYD